jgi:multidrug efflux pump subunit AcrB
VSQRLPRSLLRGPLAWMANTSVVASVLTFGLLIGGLVAARNIRQEVFPEFELDSVIVTVPYPGASPEEVEQGILMAVEEAVRGIDGVRRVRSVASEGAGTVTVELILGHNLQRLSQDVKSAVDRIVTFPEESERPRVAEATRRRRTMSVALHGPQGERVLRDTAEMIRDRMLATGRITQVDLEGIRRAEISIEIPQERLRAHGLTLAQVAQRIREASIELPGGGLKTEAGEILVRMRERRDWGLQFAPLPIVARPDGTVVRLGQLAEVRDIFEDVDRRATFNGEPAVLIDIYRIGNQKPLELARDVQAQLEELRAILPEGMHLTVVSDFADIFRQRLDLLFRNGAVGLVLVVLLLALFLEIRLALWVALGIPVSFLGALILLPSAGVSINMISVFGFIIALGIVVDDGIVVGESIYEHRTRGLSPLEAAIRGVRAVSVPVTFSVLTNIVAFLPLLTIPGTTGAIFQTVPVVVIFVFAISLAECLFALPAHVAHMGRADGGHGVRHWLHERQQAFSRAFMHGVRTRFGATLDRLLAVRWAVLATGVALLIVTFTYISTGRLRLVFFMSPDADFSEATLVLPYGSPVARTEALVRRLEEAARAVEAEADGAWIQGIFSDVGAGAGRTLAGGHAAQVRVYLPPPKDRPVSTADFTDRWRARVGAIPGVETLSFRADSGGPGSGPSLTVELSHSDIRVLQRAGEDLAAELARFEHVYDVNDGFQEGKPQYDLRLRDEARRQGLTAREVAGQVRSAFYGAEALRQQRGRDELKVMVRLPEAERRQLHTFEELWLRTPAGGEMALREAAEVEPGRAYTQIQRRDGRRVIAVEADIRPRDQTPRIEAALRAGILEELIERHPGLRAGFEGRQADLAEAMAALRIGMIAALLMIYILMVIPFRSYLQPAIILLSIPFGIVGAVWGHVLLGYTLTIISLFGILALSGVVVNDSLVLIDCTNRLRREGLDARAAVREAALQRFRPVLLTSLTTFGGLAPMIFETSRQARFLIPMAISLGFGVLFGTLITLILVPSLYVIIDDLRVVLSRGRAAGAIQGG